MTTPSKISPLLALPNEISRRILEYALDDYEQLISVSESHKGPWLSFRQFYRSTRLPHGNPKLGVMLLSKQFLCLTANIKPSKVISLVSSVESLRLALASASEWLSERISEITISRYLKLPVDVCAFNWDELYRIAQTWQSELIGACASATLKASYRIDSLNMGPGTFWTFDDIHSMTEQQVTLSVARVSSPLTAKEQTAGLLDAAGENTYLEVLRDLEE